MSLECGLQPACVADARLDAAWVELARTSPAGVFATPEWHRAVEPAYRAFGPASLLTVRDHGRLVGLLPLRVRRRFGIRLASLVGVGEPGYGTADYGALLVEPGREAEVLAAALGSLVAGRAFDLLELAQLPEGDVAEALADGLGRKGLPALVKQQNVCPRIPLPSTWAEYRATLSQNSRSWLEYNPRRLERQVGASAELVPPDEINPAYLLMRQFHRDRFDKAYRDGAEDRLTATMLAWLPAAHDAGWLRMFRLRRETETIGVLLGYAYEGTYYYHSSGFDLAFRSYSPGACLLSAALRWSVENRITCFDLLRGNYGYKDRLATEQRRNFKVLAFRRPFAAHAAMSVLSLKAHARRSGPGAWRRLEGAFEMAPAGG
jgi:CelD/BcsL family acetyltransferase involved in cellulose biosynthesis